VARHNLTAAQYQKEFDDNNRAVTTSGRSVVTW
jgi:hypothetical protein